MELTKQQQQKFINQAHKLKPVILMGDKGLTEAVLAEIDRALYDHELIKIKVNNPDREQRKAICQEICQTQGANLIQHIGKVIVIYRKSTKFDK